MQNTKTQDTLVGFFVACGIAAFFFMAMQISNLGGLSKDKIYTITARFENSGGLKVKSPALVAGVRIGRVSDISLDSDSFESVVQIDIESQYKLPVDTIASIYTAGLLGEQYISFDPGGSEEFIPPGGSIDITQSAFILEEFLGKLLINSTSK
jgi:phospholipid/cholesterol/gamma-HCH transport system substrate-binding protein